MVRSIEKKGASYGTKLVPPDTWQAMVGRNRGGCDVRGGKQLLDPTFGHLPRVLPADPEIAHAYRTVRMRGGWGLDRSLVTSVISYDALRAAAMSFRQTGCRFDLHPIPPSSTTRSASP